jgi:tripeptide aminopeptidase
MAEVNRERLVQFFLEIVRIDSLSRREREVATRLRRELENLGASCEFDRAGDAIRGDVGNLIAHLPGNRHGVAPLLLCAHMDTVVPGEGIRPVLDGDTIRSDGRTILGGDDKSGCALICEVLHQLRERDLPHGPIDAVFTIGEEIGLLGARHLDLGLVRAREGLVFDSDSPGHLIVRAPAAQGVRFTVHGVEAHAGVAPERGISAIKVAAEAIAAMRLGRIDADTTANLGTIQGGRAGNIVPNEVVVRGEARSLDARKLAAQVEHMLECFRAATARAAITLDGKRVQAELEYRSVPSYEAMSVAEDAPIVRKVVEAARRLGREVVPHSTGGGCDANVLNRRGLTVANFGTGMHDIHTLREWLDVRELVTAAEVTLEMVTLHAGA